MFSRRTFFGTLCAPFLARLLPARGASETINALGGENPLNGRCTLVPLVCDGEHWHRIIDFAYDDNGVCHVIDYEKEQIITCYP